MEPRRPGWAPRSCKLDAWNFLHFVIFDDVAFANIVELPKSDTAFEALADFRDIVGETTQRANRKVFLDDPVVTQQTRSEEHTSELQSRGHLVCRLLLEKKKKRKSTVSPRHKKLSN